MTILELGGGRKGQGPPSLLRVRFLFFVHDLFNVNNITINILLCIPFHVSKFKKKEELMYNYFNTVFPLYLIFDSGSHIMY